MSTLNEDKKNVLLTGDRPTGPLHIGHYVGSLKSRVEMQDEYDTYIMLADTQALTDNAENPDKVRNSVVQILRDYYSVGLDFSKSKIFLQSMVPQLPELTMYFMNLVSHAEVLRNPTVKTEIEQKKYGESVPFGFVAYPVSQAADILFCKANVVPVGEDQAPMIELTRRIARKFNTVYGVDVFPEPDIKLSNVKRLCGTDGGEKMGKSLGNVINLNTNDDDLKTAVMGMYTDPNRLRATDPGEVEGNPVFIYHDAFNENKEEVEDLKNRYKQGTVGDVEVKEKLLAVMRIFFEPIRERRTEIDKKSDNELMEELLSTTERVSEVGAATLSEVKDAMHINYGK